MKKIIAILSLVCFTALSISSYAGGEGKDAKAACCQKGGAEGKACCKDGKNSKSCDKDKKACSGEAKTTPAKEEKKAAK